MEVKKQDRRLGGSGAGATESVPKRGPRSMRIPTVLVVDDDEAVRESTAAILRGAGFGVLEATDGAAATWTLASEEVDVLLLDLHLCHLDGTAVMEGLEPSSRVVIFSAFDHFDEAEIRKEFEPMVFECLRKPVAPRQLIRVVAEAAADGRNEGRRPTVRPVEEPKALELALVGLARLTPETDTGNGASADDRDHEVPAGSGR